MIEKGPLNPTFVITGQDQARVVLLVAASIRKPCCFRPPLAVEGTSMVTFTIEEEYGARVKFAGAEIHESFVGPNAVQSNSM